MAKGRKSMQMEFEEARSKAINDRPQCKRNATVSSTEEEKSSSDEFVGPTPSKRWNTKSTSATVKRRSMTEGGVINVTEVMQLIDNANVEVKHCLSTKKYEGAQIRLQKMFANFLRKKGMDEMASKVESFGAQISHLDWVQSKNDVDVDCAIYVM